MTIPDEEVIFGEARRIDDPAIRAAYLAQTCGLDASLRGRIESLLNVHEGQASFLESPAVRYETSGHHAPTLLTPPGTMIGRYKLLEPIGEGGYGTVFMAEQTSPVHRKVALKIIKAGMDTRQVIARFEAERQALALMDHPNIARVFDAGMTDAGRPYFVMELVKGVSIIKYCDEHHLPPRARLELFVQVCQAVQHAHTKGIIHRDLKPSNVLVALYDGKPVPKVIDFGVAKATGQRLTERTMFTGFGDVIGTLEYMSPEQAEVNQLDVDTRSDIYSLGVLLYELLTGSTPLENKRIKQVALLEALRFIREEEPQRPSTRLSRAGQPPSIAANRGLDPKKLCGLVRGELDWIVMKALEKDRGRRYETANGMASDVQRYLDDEAVQACPPSAWYRFRKFARRNKRALASTAVLAVAALVGVTALAASTVLVSRANKDLSEAVVRERHAGDVARLEAYFQRITVAHRELSTDNLAAALRALAECPEDLRGWEWFYLARLCKVDPLVIRDNTPVNGVAFSPDGDRLASGGGDGALKIRDSHTGDVIRILERAHDGSILSVTFHRDGKHLASRGADQKVKVWDWTTGQEVFSMPCDAIRKFGSAYTVAFSPDGRQLAAGSEGAVSVWDWTDRQLLHTFAGHERNAISVAYSSDGRRMASACTGEGVKIWDPQSGGLPLRTIGGQRHPLSALAFSPDGARLASASLDHSLKLWDTNTGELLRTLLHTGNVEGVAFSPDGRLLASAGEDKTVRLWDPKTGGTGREVLGLRGHSGRCGCVVFSPDGWRLASASTDGTIRVWDATPLRPDEHQEAFTFAGHDDEIRSVVVSRDGRMIAAAGQGTLVRVWDAATRQTVAELDGNTNVVFCLAWHPDGERIAAAGWDGRLHTAHLWDVRKRAKVFSVPSGREDFALAFFSAAFSPDGRHLVMGEGSGAVRVWDARTGAPVGPLGTAVDDMHKREVRGVVFSPDGKHLATASSDGEVRLWDATRLHAKQEPHLPPLAARVPGPSSNLDFSPDGERLATGGDGNTIKIWDVRSGNLLRSIAAHGRDLYGGDVYAVAFSPDKEGRWIASGNEDSTVKIWDSRSGEMVHSFRGHTGLVSSVAFSPDGAWLVTGSRDHTVKIWDLTPLDRAASAAGGK